MKRSLLFLFALLIFGGTVLARADDNILSVQNRLKADGLYFGEPTGVLDASTSAALTRFQMRHRLMPSGKLDGPTARELNASAPKPSPTPQPLSGTWRRMKTGEMQFIEEQPAANPAASPSASSSPVHATPPPAAAPPPAEGSPVRALTAEDPIPGPPPPPPPNAAPASRGQSDSGFEKPDRVREYVEAFVGAGLDQYGSETKFFADRVDYFGKPAVLRQDIQRDLIRYDKKWPHRRFWIDGDIQIQQENGGNDIKVVFPLRYELKNGGRYASGKVLKSLTLTRGPANDLQITSVDEWKAPEQPAQ
ncbi:MAG: peptidoglycan-binding protein [Verrucomicrobia bacterium]|nr:peptidoglycan-binding protein [Verrucomicrobiota bacterium]